MGRQGKGGQARRYGTEAETFISAAYGRARAATYVCYTERRATSHQGHCRHTHKRPSCTGRGCSNPPGKSLYGTQEGASKVEEDRSASEDERGSPTAGGKSSQGGGRARPAACLLTNATVLAGVAIVAKAVAIDACPLLVAVVDAGRQAAVVPSPPCLAHTEIQCVALAVP